MQLRVITRHLPHWKDKVLTSEISYYFNGFSWWRLDHYKSIFVLAITVIIICCCQNISRLDLYSTSYNLIRQCELIVSIVTVIRVEKLVIKPPFGIFFDFDKMQTRGGADKISIRVTFHFLDISYVLNVWQHRFDRRVVALKIKSK